MLALVLFSIGTVAAIELVPRAQAGARDGEYVLLATYRAQECLETLRNSTYASLTVGGDMSGVNGCGTSVSELPSATRSVTISATPYTNLRQITVTVSWTPPGSGSTNVAVQTYRSGV